MSPIRKLKSSEFGKYVDIAARAYPGMELESPEKRKNILKRLRDSHKYDPTVKSYGNYRGRRLCGAIKLHDFEMNVFGAKARLGGGAFLAVDLPFKKEHVARELMQFFVGHFRKRGFPLAGLYPFRPDFYRKMGFGYGSKASRYVFKPAELPKGPTKEHIDYLTEKDFPAMMACSDKFGATCHGMFRRSNYEQTRFFRQGMTVLGFRRGKKLEGYLAFTFDSGPGTTFLRKDILIHEMIYHSREVLLEFLTFLNSQADQANHIVLTGVEDFWHFMPHDPRNQSDHLMSPLGHETNTQGVGIMYRIINIPEYFKILKNHDFGGQTLNLKMEIDDSFLPENAREYVLSLKKGKVVLKSGGDYDVAIKLDIAEFTSLALGVVDFKDLYLAMRAQISDESYLEAVTAVFHSAQKPVTLTQF